MKVPFSILATSLLISIPLSAAQAQATRTWVSGVGDDANPCSRTAPCKTFAGAISKTAAGGEINVLDPGGFGAVTITKSITIDGGGFIAGVLVSGTNGIVVSAGANDVVALRNLDINGVGTGIDGIKFVSGLSLEIDNTNIYGFTEAGVNIVATSPSTSPEFYIRDCNIHNNGSGANGAGIWVHPVGLVARTSIARSNVSDNLYGVRADNNSSVAIKDSQFSGNVNAGIQSSPTAQFATITVDNSLIAYNFNGLVSQGPGTATIYISNDVLTSNVNRSLATTNGSVISFGNNMIAANGVDTPPTSTVPTQ